MAMSGVRRNFSSLFGILTIVMYLFGFLIIGRGLSFRNILIIVVALLMYYVANIFSIRAKKYSLRELILSVGLNFILLLFTIIIINSPARPAGRNRRSEGPLPILTGGGTEPLFKKESFFYLLIITINYI